MSRPNPPHAEIIENQLPKDRARSDVHRHPLYYPARNHIIDFLVSRSRSFLAERKDFDRRHVPTVRPAVPEPALVRSARSVADDDGGDVLKPAARLDEARQLR